MKIDIWSKNSEKFLSAAQMAMSMMLFCVMAGGIAYFYSLQDDGKKQATTWIEQHTDWVLAPMGITVALMLIMHGLWMQAPKQRRQRVREAYLKARAEGMPWAPFG